MQMLPMLIRPSWLPVVQHVVDWLAAQAPEPSARIGMAVQVKPTNRSRPRSAARGARAEDFWSESQQLGVKLLEHVGGGLLRSTTSGEAVAATAREKAATIDLNCILMSGGI